MGKRKPLISSHNPLEDYHCASFGPRGVLVSFRDGYNEFYPKDSDTYHTLRERFRSEETHEESRPKSFWDRFR